MVLESTMICVDNSDYMRNGDFLPTRLQAQQDAVNLVCHSKIRTNAENNVGLLTLANVEVLATLTSDVGRILSKLHQVQPDGNINLLTGIRIAHLALKHRQGKNHKMRIVAFVGSPVESEEKDLVKLAKRLKKEKVSVDIVSFGEEVANNDLLTAFINTLNGKDGAGSHLVTVPPGPHLSDALISSPVIQGEDGMGGAGLGGSGFEFGVDPNEDPELALALRVSMEEQRQRQEEEARRAQAESTGTTKDATPGATPAGVPPSTPMVIARDSASEEDMLERALAMSLEGPSATPQPAVTPAAATPAAPHTPQAITTTTGSSGLPDFDHMSEEEQIAFAMHMSMQDAQDQAIKVDSPGKSRSGETPMEVEASGGDDPAGDGEDDISEVMSDPDFLQSVLENLPGVDPHDEAVRQVVGAAIAEKESKEGGGKKEKRGEASSSSSSQDKNDKKGSSDHERGKRK
ncbi:26S proteasome non-ATPase regulatory subunit 4 isoform X2 [Ischnura elegans]|uniref:26S proteasome non-ATPase regulatory subunit 4 isoform X2 n=1 Tax=Ischnura elegans TaxID=197161 RepID=UPI001ED87F63|nr:26S proteasome non-ATPase regulatory subunit 4 isoform X2 [Ischnura elegans]